MRKASEAKGGPMNGHVKVRSVPSAGNQLALRDAGPQGWWMHAACAGHDPEWWSDDLMGRSRAVAICATCPVRVRCLEEAIEHADIGVVRGGVLLTRSRHGPTRIPLLCQRCGVNPLPFGTYPPRRRECTACRREVADESVE
jgi:hypothetical protein